MSNVINSEDTNAILKIAKIELLPYLYNDIFKPCIVLKYNPDFKNNKEFEFSKILFYNHILDIIKSDNIIKKCFILVNNFKNNNYRNLNFDDNIEDKITYFACIILLSHCKENIGEQEFETLIYNHLLKSDFFENCVEKYLEDSR